MERFDGVVAASVTVYGDTVWFVAGEYYGDDDLFAAYKYDKTTDDYEVLFRGGLYVECLTAISVSQIGR